MQKDSANIKSLDTAIDIIEFLYKNGRSMSINEISKGLGLYKSTVHRMLNTMKRRGFIHQNEDDLKYSIGSRFYSIGLLLTDKLAIFDMLQPHAWKLSEKYHECIHISVPDFMSEDSPKQISVLKANAGGNVLSATPPLGIPSYAHCSASGKCLMAYSGEDYLSRYRNCALKRFTDSTITDWGIMDTELDMIRRNGYAVDMGELEDGLMCIAVPILNMKGEIIAAVSMIGSRYRLEKHLIKDVVKDLYDLIGKVETYAKPTVCYRDI
ncbi:MAG: IclR family transcriptional regulator [Eubacteriales bacterium]|nr:IclR family transcriptional regulator [Eubacteriales bacterium]